MQMDRHSSLLTIMLTMLQMVILGAGLDTRAWRLDLSERVSVYEVDQPDMSAAKGHCLRAGGAQTSRAQAGSCSFPLKCGSWTSVAADLTQDWASALQDKGFDKGEPHTGASPCPWSEELDCAPRQER